MKQILQSYKTGEIWLAEVPVPACKEGGVVIRTVNSFVSAGTERMLENPGGFLLMLLIMFVKHYYSHA
jgi:hypothetical protein